MGTGSRRWRIEERRVRRVLVSSREERCWAPVMAVEVRLKVECPGLACGVDLKEGREQQGAPPLGDWRWCGLRWEELRREGFCCVESSVLGASRRGNELN